MRLLIALLSLLVAHTLHAAEPAGSARPPAPWLRKDDVVALVGGEDMVALAEEGWLETLVTWAQPKDRIRWRSLAWEGDTVFEQRRDLNYPTLETQLDKMGATVVICQFGKMESFAGKEGVAAFTEAYEKLLARLNPEGKRRIALMEMPWFSRPPSDVISAGPFAEYGPDINQLAPYYRATRQLARKHKLNYLLSDCSDFAEYGPYFTRDGVHLKPSAQLPYDLGFLDALGIVPKNHLEGVPGMPKSPPVHPAPGIMKLPPVAEIPKLLSPIRTAIVAKNRLWFHYTRPQNWAFLAGNRTNQPSSRDHKDPTKRWFPEEMEQWVPLIEAKEREIWKLAEAPR